MNVSGFSFWYPMLMSITIFAGSMEFVTVNLLLGAFNPLQAFVMALMINARHLFYGISMLDKYRGTGWKQCYLIFGMCDESFSINYTADIPEGVDKGSFSKGFRKSVSTPAIAIMEGIIKSSAPKAIRQSSESTMPRIELV